MQGYINEAIKEYEIAIKISPNEIDYYHYLASLYLEKQNIKAAYTILNKANNINPSNPIINTLLASILCQEKKYQEDFDLFNKSIRLDGNMPLTYYSKGLCLLNLTKFQEARKNFLKDLELNKNYTEAQFLIAISYNYEGKIEKEISALEEFLLKFGKDNNEFTIYAKKRLNELKNLNKTK